MTRLPRPRRARLPEALPEPKVHSEGFRQTRAALRGALVEDYLELIAALIEDGNEARQVDIAARLGVAQPTVAKMLARLTADGLVTRKPYRGVFLTEEGRRVAAESRLRHQTVEAFLRSLGVSPETARIDAEGIEHHVSSETLPGRLAPCSSAANCASAGHGCMWVIVAGDRDVGRNPSWTRMCGTLPAALAGSAATSRRMMLSRDGQPVGLPPGDAEPVAR